MDDTVIRMNLDQYQVGLNAKEADCNLIGQILQNRSLIIASNRGPVSFNKADNGELESKRGGGGLVTALTGLANLTDAHWIASAQSEEDRKWGRGPVSLDGSDRTIDVQFLSSEPAAYDGYYNGISNSLLWFLQHSMLDITRTPTIDRKTWQDWKDGYVAVNALFAEIHCPADPLLTTANSGDAARLPSLSGPSPRAQCNHVENGIYTHALYPYSVARCGRLGASASQDAAGDPGWTVCSGPAWFPDPRGWQELPAHM